MSSEYLTVQGLRRWVAEHPVAQEVYDRLNRWLDLEKENARLREELDDLTLKIILGCPQEGESDYDLMSFEGILLSDAKRIRAALKEPAKEGEE